MFQVRASQSTGFKMEGRFLTEASKNLSQLDRLAGLGLIQLQYLLAIFSLTSKRIRFKQIIAL
jgi:hypothetical protein